MERLRGRAHRGVQVHPHVRAVRPPLGAGDAHHLRAPEVPHGGGGVCQAEQVQLCGRPQRATRGGARGGGVALRRVRVLHVAPAGAPLNRLPSLPASDGSVVGIYPRFLRPMGPL
eukprot:517807-Prorocentrum_minimum.AAC.1